MMIAHAYFPTTSQIVFKGPCLMAGVSVTADGGNADINFYDGLNNLGRYFLTVMVKNGDTRSVMFPVLTDLDKGLYVEISRATDRVTIFLVPENPKYAV